MDKRTLLAIAAALCLAPPALAQFPGVGGGGGGEADDEQKKQQQQQQDHQNSQSNDDRSSSTPSASSNTPPEQPEMPPSELDLPLDAHIKVKVEPFVAGAVVDRIIEPSVIVVESPNTIEVELFVVPVDAPYGGKALEKPHSVGRDDKASDGFKVNWSGKEKTQYVKVFAVVLKRTGSPRRYRSHTLDFGMAGHRFDGPAANPAATIPSSKTP